MKNFFQKFIQSIFILLLILVFLTFWWLELYLFYADGKDAYGLKIFIIFSIIATIVFLLFFFLFREIFKNLQKIKIFSYFSLIGIFLLMIVSLSSNFLFFPIDFESKEASGIFLADSLVIMLYVFIALFGISLILAILKPFFHKK